VVSLELWEGCGREVELVGMLGMPTIFLGSSGASSFFALGGREEERELEL